MNENVFIYIIDKEDIITSVSENWQIFAHDNAWIGKCNPENVVGHLLWDFIQGAETRQLYTYLLKKVRTGKRISPIPFRCDSPQQRRFLELRLTPLTGDHIEISSKIVRYEKRVPVGLLDNKISRSKELIRICSMCKKIAITENEWVEIEVGLKKFKVFEEQKLPGLTHGLCPACYEIAISDLDGL